MNSMLYLLVKVHVNFVTSLNTKPMYKLKLTLVIELLSP